MIRSKLVPHEEVTVKRQTNIGQYANGYPVDPVYDTFTVKGNYQPITGNEILQLEEGDRTRQVANFWTDTLLQKDDIVVRNSIEYEVRVVEDWNQQRLAHYKARIVRKDT